MIWVLTVYLMSGIGLGSTVIKKVEYTSYEACVDAADKALDISDNVWVSCTRNPE